MIHPFRCTIITPEKQVFDEEVAYASIPLHDGKLGVMAKRAPLMAQLGLSTLRVDFASSGSSKTFFVNGGFAQVQDNHLTVLTPEAIPTEELSAEIVAEAQAEADDAPQTSPSEKQRQQKLQTRAKALASAAH
ncbi:MAG: F0F1 ATP synthase subunit epsilon [Phycisphaeraceae bacterium]